MGGLYRITRFFNYFFIITDFHTHHSSVASLYRPSILFQTYYTCLNRHTFITQKSVSSKPPRLPLQRSCFPLNFFPGPSRLEIRSRSKSTTPLWRLDLKYIGSVWYRPRLLYFFWTNDPGWRRRVHSLETDLTIKFLPSVLSFLVEGTVR